MAGSTTADRRARCGSKGYQSPQNHFRSTVTGMATSNPPRRPLPPSNVERRRSRIGRTMIAAGVLLGIAGAAIISLANINAPSGHPKPTATVTVKIPVPRATVTMTAQSPRPAPTVTVTEIATTGSGGLLPALGQVGGFLVGVGTMLLGGAAFMKRRGKGQTDRQADGVST